MFIVHISFATWYSAWDFFLFLYINWKKKLIISSHSDSTGAKINTTIKLFKSMFATKSNQKEGQNIRLSAFLYLLYKMWLKSPIFPSFFPPIFPRIPVAQFHWIQWQFLFKLTVILSHSKCAPIEQYEISCALFNSQNNHKLIQEKNKNVQQ